MGNILMNGVVSEAREAFVFVQDHHLDVGAAREFEGAVREGRAFVLTHRSRRRR